MADWLRITNPLQATTMGLTIWSVVLEWDSVTGTRRNSRIILNIKCWPFWECYATIVLRIFRRNNVKVIRALKFFNNSLTSCLDICKCSSTINIRRKTFIPSLKFIINNKISSSHSFPGLPFRENPINLSSIIVSKEEQPNSRGHFT